MTPKLVSLKRNLLIIIMTNILLLQRLILSIRKSYIKTDFHTRLSSRNRKITSNKSKHLHVENELKKLKTFDSSFCVGKSHFEEDGKQRYLVFQPIYRYLQMIAGVGNGS